MASETKQRLKLLVIDDSVEALELSKLKLEKKGFEVLTLESAQNCLDVITTNNIDLVILDIIMPDIDGNQALQMIREKYNQIQLPIIMMTAKSDAADIIDALKSGANDYITKPVQFDIAHRKIETHLLVAKLSKALGKNKEIQALHATIATYNHELNNPLTICLGKLALFKKKYGEGAEIDGLEKALWRISDILKKTEDVLAKDSVSFDNYDADTLLIKLEKKK